MNPVGELGGVRVLVMGLGRSGRSAALLARAKGAEVVGIDLREQVPAIDGVTLELGPHRDEVFAAADLIVVSPGIPPSQHQLRAAMERGTPVVGELAFADRFLDARTVAITGTNGKSTVTWFTHQLLEASGIAAFVGGNLGNPLSNAALEPEPSDCVVVEVSSYQLELPGTFRPNLGVILNLTPDHLARHGSMEAYASAKARLFERMTAEQWGILPKGDERLIQACGASGQRGWLGAHPGVVRTGNDVHVSMGALDVQLTIQDLAVPGAHNAENAACAALCALAMGADAERVQAAIGNLRALPHRMEVVAQGHGVRWINDSKATNIDAARAGIEGLSGTAVILLGGQGKAQADGTLGMSVLASALRRHRAVIAFGEDGPRIASELADAGVQVVATTRMEDAVSKASEVARGGDSVLLSPACASFDAFDDFEHRGRVFAAMAKEWAQ